MLFRGTAGQAVLSYMLYSPFLSFWDINFKFGLATIVLSHSIEYLFNMAIQLQDFIVIVHLF